MTATTVDIDQYTSAAIIASFHEELTARNLPGDLIHELTLIAAKALMGGSGYLNARRPTDV